MKYWSRLDRGILILQLYRNGMHINWQKDNVFLSVPMYL